MINPGAVLSSSLRKRGTAAGDPRRSLLHATPMHRALLIGNRIVCLVQSNDPGLKFAAVGAMPVLWKDAEWSAKRRL
ncbi:hypothetical protein [Flexivirga caeni]|uniref:hypothetical protein n=1 Tax=Flexivirga caeni TaxID=2294115 RepID=UPI0015E896B8|nr:hypothetical protein [Flexivirga caeni]